MLRSGKIFLFGKRSSGKYQMNLTCHDHSWQAGVGGSDSCPELRLCWGLLRCSAAILVFATALLLQGFTGEAQAAKGKNTPYFAALKADEVHVRKGPARSYDILWTFRSLGLPVEVTAEHEHWRRIRDSTGSEGWVYFRLISNLRMALITPWQTEKGVISLNKSSRAGSPVIARLEPGVKVLVKSCTGTSCLVSVGGFKGWIEQKKLWGVYPGETLN
jgi:SH3-like domain-containing protein